jgi:hypothetical protein
LAERPRDEELRRLELRLELRLEREELDRESRDDRARERRESLPEPSS